MAKLINYQGIIGFTVLYVITVFATAFLGFLSPVCWAGFAVVAAFLGAFSYYGVASRWQKFGAATLLSIALGGLLLALGECDIERVSLMVAAGIISDVVRQAISNQTPEGQALAFPVLSIGVIAWVLPLWTRTEWYYQGAIGEMGEDYAKGLMSLANPWFLVLIILLTAFAGYIGICIAAKTIKS